MRDMSDDEREDYREQDREARFTKAITTRHWHHSDPDREPEPVECSCGITYAEPTDAALCESTHPEELAA